MALFARANANASLLSNNCYLLKLTCHDVMLRCLSTYSNKFSNAERFSMCTCLVRSALTSNTVKNFARKCHFTPHDKNYKPFDEVLNRRRGEATRSILVQVQSSKSYEELYMYCKNFGVIKGMYHYSIKDNLHFYLIEFTEVLSATAALDSATRVNFDEAMPVRSPMVWFRNIKFSRTTENQENLSSNNEKPEPTEVNSCRIPRAKDVERRLADLDSISDQMILLHDTYKLDEVGIRLRFLTAHQLERSFVGFFPHITVFPFGSSVNGFGKRGCDLDLVLSLEPEQMENTASRFIFHTKMISADSKLRSKKLLENIADSMDHLLPGIGNVRRILQARVPIIKYNHTLTGLECDLSLTNMTAVYMAELLCIYGEIDWRVRPLVFTIRHWAQSIGLTNPSPGRWITNFSISLLVLYYLQQRSVLPNINKLKSLAGKSDIRLADNAVDCTFLRDVTKLPSPNPNVESLETLLRGFFEFYAAFDFATKRICLRQGENLFKPDFSPLYISNPLETALNVSQNVSLEETERMKVAMRNAAWILEAAGDSKTRRSGILSIFEDKLGVISYVAGKRTVNLEALFTMPGGNKSSASRTKNSKSKKDTETKTDETKNEVKSEVTEGLTKLKKGRARRR